MQDFVTTADGYLVLSMLVMDKLEEEGKEGRSSEDKSPSMRRSRNFSPGVIPRNPLVEGFGSLTLALSPDSLFSPLTSLFGSIVSF
ncbi:hypothetical protein E2C01_006145 [Portunus trituberculatus]|uniref:Uncharacterized protein n=1 Tax=Portunus trituberculatus TaxID=210409 RepID=A0A5B7CUH5_PORTR|nr:hypothetical protein [Portunus trituberculatus]